VSRDFGSERVFIKIKFQEGNGNLNYSATFRYRSTLCPGKTRKGGNGKVQTMKKTALVLATAATIGLSAVTAPSRAEARGGWGWGGALAGGLIAGAVIGGLASSAYGYPGYGYYGGYPGYYGGYGGYAPAYYGGYAPAYYGGYTSYYDGYAPAYYGGYRYRRAIRPAYAYYGGPRYYVRHHRHYRHY
jgi:hypothetical protein